MMTALNRALIVPRVPGEGIGVERWALLSSPPCPRSKPSRRMYRRLTFDYLSWVSNSGNGWADYRDGESLSLQGSSIPSSALDTPYGKE